MEDLFQHEVSSLIQNVQVILNQAFASQGDASIKQAYLIRARMTKCLVQLNVDMLKIRLFKARRVRDWVSGNTAPQFFDALQDMENNPSSSPHSLFSFTETLKIFHTAQKELRKSVEQKTQQSVALSKMKSIQEQILAEARTLRTGKAIVTQAPLVEIKNQDSESLTRLRELQNKKELSQRKIQTLKSNIDTVRNAVNALQSSKAMHMGELRLRELRLLHEARTRLKATSQA
jgi:hypothetical protein